MRQRWFYLTFFAFLAVYSLGCAPVYGFCYETLSFDKLIVGIYHFLNGVCRPVIVNRCDNHTKREGKET